jgi:hypothetical protein
VENVGDVGLGGEAAQGGGVVLLGCGLNCGDTEVLVTPGEVCAGGGDASLGVAGDGRVAVEDEVTVRSDAGGINLSASETRQKDRQNKVDFDDATAEPRGSRSVKRQNWTIGVGVNKQDCTSVCAEV